MPHGAGGGSHFGGHVSGSHGGGGFHGRSGGSSGGYRSSNSYYPGAKRYFYHYHRRPYVYYADARESGTNDLRTAGIIIMLLGLLLSLGLFLVSPLPKAQYKLTSKLSRNYNDAIVIEDNLGIIADKEDLENCLEKFLKRTGICICVVTRTTSDGRKTNVSCQLKRRSFYEYGKRWEDEKHWLIYYEGDEINRSDNWSYYVICGDDGVSIIDYEQEELFTMELYRYFSDSENYTFEEAVIKAVGSLKPDLKGGFIYKSGAEYYGRKVGGTRVKIEDFSWNGYSFVAYLFVLSLIIMGLVYIIISFTQKEQNELRKARAKAKETADATSALIEEKCKYCEGIYYKDTVEKCPYCKSPIAEKEESFRTTKTTGVRNGSIEDYLNQMYQGEIIRNENMQVLVEEMNKNDYAIYHPSRELKDVLCKTNEYLNYKGSFQYYDRRGNVETVTPATFREFVIEWFSIPDRNPDILYNEIIEEEKRKNFWQAEKLGFFAENQDGMVQPVTAWQVIEDYFNDMTKDESRYMILTSPRPQFGVKSVVAARRGDQIELQILIKEKNKYYGMQTDGSSARKMIMDFFYGRFVPDMKIFTPADVDIKK